MIAVGSVGLGHMGLLHLRNTRFIEDIQVVAAADRSEKSLAEAESFGVKNLYKDYHEMLKLDNLDAVIISLPNFLHEECITLFAEKGVNIFVEKPLARTLSECERIERVIKKSGSILCVGHNYRFFEHVRRLKEEHEKGTLGEVELANMEHFVNGPFAHPLEPRPVPDWWLNPELSGGGVLLDQGSHLIDLFRWFFPKPRLVYANLGYRYGLGLEDSAIIVLESQGSGTRGIISVGWFQKMIFPQFNFRVTLQGTTRFLSTEDFAPKNMYYTAAKEALKNIVRKVFGKKINVLSYTYYYTSYFKEIQLFFESVKSGKYMGDVATIDDGLETVKVIEETYRRAGNSRKW